MFARIQGLAQGRHALSSLRHTFFPAICIAAIKAVAEREALLKKVAAVLRSEQIRINPDSGLKTRTWKKPSSA